jgi:hypothetical protein
MSDWKIRRRHGECSTCEGTFEDGTRHASSLRFDEEETLVREDLCETCWDDVDESGYLFWWFTRHQEDRKKTVQLDLGSLERLFMELDGRGEEKLRELRYLLCLLLMRKRKLKLIKVKRGSKGEELVLRRPRRTEELSVWVYDFTPDRMEELRTRLQEVLDGMGSDEPAKEGDPESSSEEASNGQEPGAGLAEAETAEGESSDSGEPQEDAAGDESEAEACSENSNVEAGESSADEEAEDRACAEA